MHQEEEDTPVPTVAVPIDPPENVSPSDDQNIADVPEPPALLPLAYAMPSEEDLIESVLFPQSSPDFVPEVASGPPPRREMPFFIPTVPVPDSMSKTLPMLPMLGSLSLQPANVKSSIQVFPPLLPKHEHTDSAQSMSNFGDVLPSAGPRASLGLSHAIQERILSPAPLEIGVLQKVGSYFRFPLKAWSS